MVVMLVMIMFLVVVMILVIMLMLIMMVMVMIAMLMMITLHSIHHHILHRLYRTLHLNRMFQSRLHTQRVRRTRHHFASFLHPHAQRSHDFPTRIHEQVGLGNSHHSLQPTNRLL